MTREEAIICLKGIKNLGHDIFTEQKDFQESLNITIKKLEQEPCDDAVSRAEAINGLQKICDECDSEFCGECRIDTEGTSLDSAKEMLKRLPPVTPTKCIATVKFSKEDMQELVNEKMKDIVVERKKGKWINKSQKSGCGITFVASECTCCGMKTPFDCDNFIYRYCPNCGAKMVEPQESEKINCKSTKCENCINHNYCDFEPQESEE